MVLPPLDERDVIVSNLQNAMARGSASLMNIPAIVKRICHDEMWRHRKCEGMGGKVVEFPSFEAFVRAPLIEGLEADINILLRLCRDDKAALDAIDQAVKREGGRPGKTLDNVQGFPSGNTEQAALRRLRKDRPDLHRKVMAGKMSAHAAMIAAGFRQRSITVPTDPASAARRLRNHFRGDRLAALIAALRED